MPSSFVITKSNKDGNKPGLKRVVSDIKYKWITSLKTPQKAEE